MCDELVGIWGGKKHNKPTNNVKKTYQIVKIDEKVGLGGFLWS